MQLLKVLRPEAQLCTWCTVTKGEDKLLSRKFNQKQAIQVSIWREFYILKCLCKQFITFHVSRCKCTTTFTTCFIWFTAFSETEVWHLFFGYPLKKIREPVREVTVL